MHQDLNDLPVSQFTVRSADDGQPATVTETAPVCACQTCRPCFEGDGAN